MSLEKAIVLPADTESVEATPRDGSSLQRMSMLVTSWTGDLLYLSLVMRTCCQSPFLNAL